MAQCLAKSALCKRLVCSLDLWNIVLHPFGVLSGKIRPDLFLESNFASVFTSFVLTDSPSRSSLSNFASVLSYLVLKFFPIQSIFKTKSFPNHGLFVKFLPGDKCPVQGLKVNVHMV